MSDWTTSDVSVRLPDGLLKLSDLAINPDMPVNARQILTGLVQFCFSGLGLGASRFSEYETLKIRDLHWYNGHLYYYTYSNKSPSATQGRSRLMPSEHRLPASLSRIVLLFRYLFAQETGDILFAAGESGTDMVDFVKLLFEHDRRPTKLVIRKFHTSLTNLLFDANNGELAASGDVATKSNHSAKTHQQSYGSRVLGADDERYKRFYAAIGELVEETDVPEEAPFTNRQLLASLRSVRTRLLTKKFICRMVLLYRNF